MSNLSKTCGPEAPQGLLEPKPAPLSGSPCYISTSLGTFIFEIQLKEMRATQMLFSYSIPKSEGRLAAQMPPPGCEACPASKAPEQRWGCWEGTRQGSPPAPPPLVLARPSGALAVLTAEPGCRPEGQEASTENPTSERVSLSFPLSLGGCVSPAGPPAATYRDTLGKARSGDRIPRTSFLFCR